MTLDQHFTDTAMADELVRSLIQRLDPTCVRRYIEPSCGSGVFVDALRKAGVPRQQIVSVEIDPAFPADIHGDFLATNFKTTRESTLVIGNPPFGRGGQLARCFLNKAAEYADWVCLVLPRSMHGANNCGTVNPRLGLIYEKQLDGGFSTTKAKCNWQEWFCFGHFGQRPTETKHAAKGLYQIVTKDADYNVVIQRCGGSAGRVTNCNNTGEGKYYIRSRHPEVLAALCHLGRHEEADLTTHQSSLSRRMLHELIERQLLKQYLARIRK